MSWHPNARRTLRRRWNGPFPRCTRLRIALSPSLSPLILVLHRFRHRSLPYRRLPARQSMFPSRISHLSSPLSYPATSLMSPRCRKLLVLNCRPTPLQRSPPRKSSKFAALFQASCLCSPLSTSHALRRNDQCRNCSKTRRHTIRITMAPQVPLSARVGRRTHHPSRASRRVTHKNTCCVSRRRRPSKSPPPTTNQIPVQGMISRMAFRLGLNTHHRQVHQRHPRSSPSQGASSARCVHDEQLSRGTGTRGFPASSRHVFDGSHRCRGVQC